MALIEVEEDGLIVSVPENRYFRFEESPAYDSIKAQGLKEMDFGWMLQGDALWLLELKDYGAHIPAQVADQREKLRRDLPAKIVHSVLMISCIWADTPFGQSLRDDIERTFPNFPSQPHAVRAVTVINLENQSDKALLPSLQDAVRAAVDAIGLESVQILPVGHDAVQDRLGIEVTQKP